MTIELGISTFGETTLLESTGKAISHDQRIRELVEEIELADQVGLDIYAIGEHHLLQEQFPVPTLQNLHGDALQSHKYCSCSRCCEYQEDSFI